MTLPCSVIPRIRVSDAHDFRTHSPEPIVVEHQSVQDSAALLKSDTPPHIIDVREQWEWDIAHIEGSTLIPLSTLPAQVHTLDTSRTYALLCHHGMRSEMAANWLAQHGFASLINIDGGIDAWSLDVDPSLPRY